MNRKEEKRISSPANVLRMHFEFAVIYIYIYVYTSTLYNRCASALALLPQEKGKTSESLGPSYIL